MFLTKKIMLRMFHLKRLAFMLKLSDSPLVQSGLSISKLCFFFFFKNPHHTGKPFMYVTAFDRDDPSTLHSNLSYSILHQFPSTDEMYFQIDNVTGAISTTEAGR